MAQETDWLRTLLGISELRGLCYLHERYKTTFCIDCRLDLCPKCANDHEDSHRRIRLYRNNNYHVFRHKEIKKHFDCSKIQTYKKYAGENVRLKSKPDAGKEPKPSKNEAPHVTCEGCGENPIYAVVPYRHNRFCSIQCKFLSDDVEPEDDQNSEVESPPPESVEEKRHSS